MAKDKTMRWIAFRVGGVAAALALTSVVLVTSPAAATVKSTSTVVTASTPAETGAPIVFTATVSRDTHQPTGTVTFTIVGSDSSTPMCDGGSNTITLVQNATNSTAECSISPPPTNTGFFADASPYAITAMYSGDSNFATSTGVLSEVISRAQTNTTVVPASNPTVTGQPVSFTATVVPTAPATGVPTGSVNFSITGSAGTVPCDGSNSQPLDGNDMATCSVAGGLLAADSPYTVNATYTGDANYKMSTGTTTQDVGRATVTIGVTSSESTLVTGQPVMFTATITGVNPPGMGTPTGSINFTVTGSDMSTATCQGGDSQPLSGGSAVCNFPSGLPGSPLTYTITARLQDLNFKDVVNGTLVQPVKRATTETIVSHAPVSLLASQAFKFQITIKTEPPGTGAPTDKYEWAVCPYNQQGVCTPKNGTKGDTGILPNPTAKDITKGVNKVTVSVPGGLNPGFYAVTAKYVGNIDLSPSSSSTTFMLVKTIPTTLSVSPNHNPMASGKGFNLRVGVIPNGLAGNSLGAPSGTVTYQIKGASGDLISCTNGTDNAVTISTTKGNQGLAKCKVAPGQMVATDSPYQWKVTYSGDSNYQSSVAHGTETVEVVG